MRSPPNRRCCCSTSPRPAATRPRTAEIDALIVEVARSGIAVVLVEHDMKMVMAISDRVHVLAQGRTLMEGKPQEVARDPRVIEAYLGAGLPGLGEAPDHA